MLMEGSIGSAFTVAGFSGRRRRSALPRRPRYIKGGLHSFTFISPSTQANTSLVNEANPSFRNTDNLCGPVSENPLKLKLKLNGVTRTTIQTNSQASGHKPLQNKVQGNGLERKNGQKTLFLKEINRSKGYTTETLNGASMSEKSKRGLKKRKLDPEPDSNDDDDGDEEINYLKKLKSKRLKDSHKRKENEGGRRLHIHGHDMEDREQFSSDEVAVSEKKKPRNGMVPTTRTRALQLGKDPCSVISSGLEFPDGLPCASSKRQKQKLSEVEQQSKKAEAAQRRRIQSEKAAQEAEAEAIRKILGQDSGRRKKEDKIKKQQEERAQERAERSRTLASNTIRLVMGPSGTTMTFSEDIGLPDIFKPITHSYPPPREKCVGPNCEKEYKYRDSKSKLPLCSLGCYKAIQEKGIEKQQQPLIHC